MSTDNPRHQKKLFPSEQAFAACGRFSCPTMISCYPPSMPTALQPWARSSAILLMVLLLASVWGAVVANARAEEAYIQRNGDAWTIGTAKVERELGLKNGRLVSTSWKDKKTGRQLLPEGIVSDELQVILDGQQVSGTTGGWALVRANARALTQGAKQLEITVRRGDLEATKSYIVYPQSSIIREYVSFKNVGTGSLRVSEPGFLNITAKLGLPESVDFYWMTGGKIAPDHGSSRRSFSRRENPEYSTPTIRLAEQQRVILWVTASSRKYCKTTGKSGLPRMGTRKTGPTCLTGGCMSPMPLRTCPCGPQLTSQRATSSISS